jgi:hypothetical protein
MEEFLIDEEENDFYSDSSSNSYHDEFEHDKEPVLNTNLNKRFENKQLETLKYLRHLLHENKMLRQRIEVTENELIKYEEYHKSFLNSNSNKKKIMPLDVEIQTERQSARLDEIFQLKQPIVNIIDDREIENEEELEQLEEVKSISCSIVPVRDLESPLMKQKNDKSCQIDDSSMNDKLKIKELSLEIENMKSSHRDEIENLNKIISDFRENFLVLSEKIENLEKNCEITNAKYSESEKKCLKLIEENQLIETLNQKIDLITAENQQLFSELKLRQNDLENTNSNFLDLTKTINESMRIIEEQKESILILEAENERHLREKHISCESKINELFALNEELNQILTKRNEKLDQLTLENQELEKQVVRYKSDLKNFNFKEFVSMKRELNALKQEKERMFANIVTLPSKEPPQQTPSPLPPIKSENSKKNPNNFFNSKN